MEPEYKAVVFDMDGVLFDTERISRDCWRLTAAEWGLQRIDEVYPLVIGVNHTDGITILQEAYGADFACDPFMAECGRKMKRKLAEEGLPVKEGVRELLAFLKAHQIPTVICSSTSVPVIRDHLDKTGLSEYFSGIVGGDMVEHSKPQPDIYLKACSLLRIEPRYCFAVEDSPNGIRSASRAGLMAVMVPDLVSPTEELMKLSFRIEESLSDFLKYLISITSSST